jgi:hypothetical protein
VKYGYLTDNSSFLGQISLARDAQEVRSEAEECQDDVPQQRDMPETTEVSLYGYPRNNALGPWEGSIV